MTLESGTGGASAGSGDVAIRSAPQATGVTGAVSLGSGPNAGGAGTGDVRIASGAEKLHPASPARHLLLQETQREVQAVM